MDALDIRLLRGMGARPYGKLPKDPETLRASHLAREVGTSVVTAKERIARMEGIGVIAGYQVYPNLRHLGLASTAFLHRVPDEDRKARALEEAKLVDGLMEVHDFLGPPVCIDVAYAGAGELERKVRLLANQTGDAAPLRLYEREMPAVERPLKHLDWRILAALRGRALRPLQEIADELKVNPRTVKRHYDAMAKEGSFLAVPLLDLGKAEGLFPFFLNFSTGPNPSRATLETILHTFEERRVHTYFPCDTRLGNLGLMLFAKSAAEVEEMRHRGAALPGVQRVGSWVYKGFHDYTPWLDDAIAARVKASAG
ncbi:MAG TPA: winged helix-turn-helix transcriptional regulator [Candidatus Thermoplasmatota archaeon]|nr:winged helix-turn-helix transcriptional regulator [Candidatus Thermoplasmatota archaeon]